MAFTEDLVGSRLCHLAPQLGSLEKGLVLHTFNNLGSNA